jgi:hypothetical protein
LGNFESLIFNEVSYFETKFPIIVLLRFYAIEQLWTAEDMRKDTETFRKGRSIKHTADVSNVPRSQKVAKLYLHLVKKVTWLHELFGPIHPLSSG